MDQSPALNYEAPGVLVSYGTSDLVEDAARCQQYPSDAALKTDVRSVEKPLGGVSGIGTRH